MKCIVINLPRAKARLRAMKEQLSALNLEFEILCAIDWRDLTATDLANVDRETRKLEGRRALSQGMIACHLSHRKAIEGVAEGRADLAAILEDDVTLAPKIGDVLKALELAYSSGTEFDIVFLHRNKTYLPYVALKTIDDNVTLGLTKYSDWGAHSYVISKKGASRLLKRYPRIVHRNDHTLHAYWESGLSVFSLEDSVAFHGNQAGSHSFLQEGTLIRFNWSIYKLPRRFRSLLREEILKRKFFSKRSRESETVKVASRY